MTTSASNPGPRSAAAAAGMLSGGDLPPELHFIDGEFRAGSGGVHRCRRSVQRVVFARVPEGTADDVDAAVTAARAAQPAWAGDPKERAAVLLGIADRVERDPACWSGWSR